MAAPDQSNPILIHFYRAVVGHADVWRQRMDSTTNWAAVTTAGMITFSFSRPDAPHFVLLLALVFDGGFLLMESRRYQSYDRWRRQFHALNRYLIAPALEGSTTTSEKGFKAILDCLSRTVPHLRLWQAVGYRLRRNYGYLFGVVLLSWLLKLHEHPAPAATWAETFERAAVGLVSAEAVLAAAALFALGAVVLGVLAPSEQMVAWAEVGSPWGRLADRSWIPGRTKPARAPAPGSHGCAEGVPEPGAGEASGDGPEEGR